MLCARNTADHYSHLVKVDKTIGARFIVVCFDLYWKQKPKVNMNEESGE